MMILKVFLVLVGVNIIHGYTLRMKRGTTCEKPPHYGGSCTCTDDIAHCVNLIGLESFRGAKNYTRLEIESSPLIGSFVNNSFQYLNVKQLALNKNNLRDSSIGDWTFYPLKNKLLSLNLANNRLSQLPEALVELDILEKLNVVGNPINEDGFKESIMRKLGKVLLEFHFGSKTDLLAWPKTLKHLQMLEVLEVNGGDFSLIPERAFYGFEGTLRKLTIQNTDLMSVPLAIVELNFLDTLHFDHNVNVGDAGMNVPLVKGLLRHLQNASLNDDGIKTFPLILGEFENLENLKMNDNGLNFVSDKSAKSVSKIISLSLRHSGINRIPGALLFMTSLQTLDMSNNTIHGIEQSDLSNLNFLKVLNVSFNPILYVSPDAFSGVKSSLNTIYLQHTSLTKVPRAITVLRSSNITLDLSGNQIECTCELKWLYTWISTTLKNVNVIGECETVESSINKYISTTLKLCP